MSPYEETTLPSPKTYKSLLILPSQSSGGRHPSHNYPQGQHLTARYFAAEKIGAILDRLREPAASYNRLIRADTFISQATSVFLVLQLVATADSIKIWEAETCLQQNLIERNGLIDEDQSRYRRQIRIKLARSFVEVLFTLAITLHLAQILGPDSLEGAALMGLTATLHLVLLEAREQEIFLARTSAPLRSLPLSRFDSMWAGNGHDCPICQDDVGEQEWVYSLPCKHQFHR